ncbi:MAG: hypothetical protein NTV86_19550 [Planctomycetota bacterium]|nr:hypothetical protein [Planctomycetota bacterium]
MRWLKMAAISVGVWACAWAWGCVPEAGQGVPASGPAGRTEWKLPDDLEARGVDVSADRRWAVVWGELGEGQPEGKARTAVCYLVDLQAGQRTDVLGQVLRREDPRIAPEEASFSPDGTHLAVLVQVGREAYFRNKDQGGHRALVGLVDLKTLGVVRIISDDRKCFLWVGNAPVLSTAWESSESSERYNLLGYFEPEDLLEMVVLASDRTGTKLLAWTHRPRAQTVPADDKYESVFGLADGQGKILRELPRPACPAVSCRLSPRGRFCTIFSGHLHLDVISLETGGIVTIPDADWECEPLAVTDTGEGIMIRRAGTDDAIEYWSSQGKRKVIVPYKTVATIAGEEVFFVEYREEGCALKAIPLPR